MISSRGYLDSNDKSRRIGKTILNDVAAASGLSYIAKWIW